MTFSKLEENWIDLIATGRGNKEKGEEEFLFVIFTGEDNTVMIMDESIDRLLLFNNLMILIIL
ncbi:hypothetical protein QR98_0042420 [Sarcoptes scabiei]|uniref:Uncharacterized protein n=1 Tax=Sarcoptes scabiei TaxID=52283 RepID=A0A132A465_SARSC|nr:hypothetical protein QR98_0042420 [Sarcoptes scabiei]